MITRALPMLLAGCLLVACSSAGERVAKLRSDVTPDALVREIGTRTQRLSARAQSGISELARTPRLVDGARRLDLDPRVAGTRVSHAGKRVPTVLGLDRQPLAGPTDPGAVTSAFYDGQREGWAERVGRRLPW